MSSTPPGKEEAILKDFPDPTHNLLHRLESWIHVVDMIDEYVDSHILIQKNITQGLEKARKAISDAPRFDYRVGRNSEATSPVGEVPPSTGSEEIGVAESFETLRTRTDGLINKSIETEQSLKSSVLPQLTTLKGDIEKHIKGLKATGIKNSKDIEKAKSVTQSSIETLGQYVSSFSINTHSKLDYKNDPYVLHRYAMNALEDQIGKENNQIDALISIEKNFETLERHITQVIQQAVSLLDSALSNYSTLKVESYQTISATFSAIPADYEWQSYIKNPSSMLIPYDTPKRQLENIHFTNCDAPSTKPLIEGILQRKEGKLLKSYTSGYYVLTPSRFLLQYSSQNHVKDPTPDFAIYLPDSQVGEMSSRSSGKNKFVIQAKDTARTIGLGHKNYSFKTNTYDELTAWYSAITNQPVAGAVASPGPASPAVTQTASFSSGTAVPAAAPTYVESSVADPSVAPVSEQLSETKLS